MMANEGSTGSKSAVQPQNRPDGSDPICGSDPFSCAQPAALRRTIVHRCAVILGWLLATPMLTSAQAPTAGKVIVILASEKPGTIDPSLKELAALKRPPLNAYRSMAVESRRSLRLMPHKAQEVPLPNGRTLKLEIEKVNANGSFQVSASLKTPQRTKYALLLKVTASPGDPFFVAGQSYKGGTLILGVILGDRPAKSKR